MNAVADVKTRLKEYKQRVNHLEAEIRNLEQTLIDERTKASVYQMEQEQLIATMKESFKQENLKLLASNKQIVEKLLAEKRTWPTSMRSWPMISTKPSLSRWAT